MADGEEVGTLIADSDSGNRIAETDFHKSSPLSPGFNRHDELGGVSLGFRVSRRFPQEHLRPASFFGLVRSGGEVLVESRNGLMQAIGDHLRVVCQRRTGVGMAEVTLQILHARVLLNVCGRSSP